MTTNYKRGADFERRAQKLLERIGYAVVRSAGSHSPADLVAMRHGELVCVQCKRDGRLDPEEWNEYWEFCELAGALPVMAQVGPQGKGVTYHKLTGRKDGRGRQPMEFWEPRREHEV
jgi:Holliday junction resolvase